MSLYKLSAEMASRAGRVLDNQCESDDARSLAGHVLDQAAEIARMQTAHATEIARLYGAIVGRPSNAMNTIAGGANAFAPGAHEFYR